MDIPITTLQIRTQATIVAIISCATVDLVAQRLKDLGFIPGESVQILARTPFQEGPLVVKTPNHPPFALRHSEATRILVSEGTLSSHEHH